jgi:hypothetical protein
LSEAETELCRLTLLLEKAEGDNRALVEDKQGRVEELSKLRVDMRHTQEKLGVFRQEAQQEISRSEEGRHRYELLSEQQRERIQNLEESLRQAVGDGDEKRKTARVQGEAMYRLLVERGHVLALLAEVLGIMQGLFYDPTPFVGVFKSQNRATAVPKVKGRLPQSNSSARLARAKDYRDCSSDLRDIIQQLEKEIADSAQVYTGLVQRVGSEAERCAKLVVSQEGQEPTVGEVNRIVNIWSAITTFPQISFS